jgi:NDP-sugar pyrophosphorylase family protein
MTGPNKFDSEEYIYPKPLIDINGKTIIERSFESYKGFDKGKTIIPIISLADVRDFNLDYVIRQLVPADELSLIELENRTGGALCTALLAIEEVDNDTPLIVTNGDHIIDHDVAEIVDWFNQQDADFGVVTFDAVHPKWSYVRLNVEGEIEESAEKRPISKHAIAGLYYYRKGSDFIEAAKRSIAKKSTHAGLYFISASLNEMVLMGKKGCAYQIDNDKYTHFYDISAVKSYSERIKQSALQGETEIRRLTRKYVSAFNSRRLEEVTSLMHEEISLEDPDIKRIDGLSNVSAFLGDVFSSSGSLEFSAVDIAVFHNKSFIQFELKVDDKHIRGVDIITWCDGKMESLVAHMEEI